MRPMKLALTLYRDVISGVVSLRGAETDRSKIGMADYLDGGI